MHDVSIERQTTTCMYVGLFYIMTNNNNNTGPFHALKPLFLSRSSSISSQDSSELHGEQFIRIVLPSIEPYPKWLSTSAIYESLFHPREMSMISERIVKRTHKRTSIGFAVVRCGSQVISTNYLIDVTKMLLITHAMCTVRILITIERLAFFLIES